MPRERSNFSSSLGEPSINLLTRGYMSRAIFKHPDPQSIRSEPRSNTTILATTKGSVYSAKLESTLEGGVLLDDGPTRSPHWTNFIIFESSVHGFGGTNEYRFSVRLDAFNRDSSSLLRAERRLLPGVTIKDLRDREEITGSLELPDFLKMMTRSAYYGDPPVLAVTHDQPHDQPRGPRILESGWKPHVMRTATWRETWDPSKRHVEHFIRCPTMSITKEISRNPDLPKGKCDLAVVLPLIRRGTITQESVAFVVDYGQVYWKARKEQGT